MTWRGPRTAANLTAEQRGYGTAHRKARAKAAAAALPSDPCVRCGKPLGPMGPWLHYDHNQTRNGYLGFSHAQCNRRAGAQAGQRAQHRKQRIKITTSKRW